MVWTDYGAASEVSITDPHVKGIYIYIYIYIMSFKNSYNMFCRTASCVACSCFLLIRVNSIFACCHLVRLYALCFFAVFNIYAFCCRTAACWKGGCGGGCRAQGEGGPQRPSYKLTAHCGKQRTCIRSPSSP